VHPSIGELIPVRESPLPHGQGCRWVTYWEGRSGWALVAICREPGSATPIHAHPHRLIGKAIEGVLEELRFTEVEPASDRAGEPRRCSGTTTWSRPTGWRRSTWCASIGARPAIDLQLRGPEVGRPGRRMRTTGPLDLDALRPGVRISVIEELDDRPGQGGEGAAAGRPRVPESGARV
jgi:hypothetical protein